MKYIIDETIFNKVRLILLNDMTENENNIYYVNYSYISYTV